MEKAIGCWDEKYRAWRLGALPHVGLLQRYKFRHGLFLVCGSTCQERLLGKLITTKMVAIRACSGLSSLDHRGLNCVHTIRLSKIKELCWIMGGRQLNLISQSFLVRSTVLKCPVTSIAMVAQRDGAFSKTRGTSDEPKLVWDSRSELPSVGRHLAHGLKKVGRGRCPYDNPPTVQIPDPDHACVRSMVHYMLVFAATAVMGKVTTMSKIP
ncbi:hypothetical protein E2P81_ATG02549 [Venturia nashicola]|uniref:Uncharacterized protein n=1 Tax=Venturia nashicola TaxID=86259 RepID=A0A4Z1PG02_9PEZI|nr:hypothetical protein E6O75_ATG02611 [Venturia nashicola]TLD36767.1 hypothetical protein E2P81_ATG02549 [Venturia nashicola]